MSSILSLHNVSYSYESLGGKPILRELSMDIRTGEFVSIVGVSGSGKSTLFRLIAGLLEPAQGEIRLQGRSAEKRLGKVAYMPQKDLLLPWRTVLDNCLLPLEIAGGDGSYTRGEIQELLVQFGLGGCEHAYPAELSGGMRQRAAFLRTLAGGQELLLLDEPFGALDTMTKRDMQRWLLAIWDDLRKTVLFITHDLEEAILLSDRIYMMPRKGQSGMQEIEVSLPRPRHNEMNYELAFVQLRQRLERQLYAEST